MNINVAPLLKTDFKSVLIIADKLFGDGFLNSAELNDCIMHKGKSCLVARKEGEIVGFIIIQICGFEELMALALDEQSWFKEQFAEDLPIGVIKSIAVNSVFKKQGVGMALTTNGIEFLKDKTHSIISICWEQNGDIPFSRLLEKCGLKSIHKFAGFWSENSLFEKYSCRICGEPPCNCNAYIYQS